ncbi:Small RNA 2'-O-methyltransferase [Euphorbia peplus]|nr:Small RNA 2'-O-methyltransferase [Euphorbia peplus]
MGTRGPVATATPKKTTLTPKSIIHQRFGAQACYKVEEVQDSVQNGCPGLAIPQKGPSLYRCTLQLPEFFVASDAFKRKKDAEQCAAEMALQRLGIDPAADNPMELEPWDALTHRMTYLFADEFIQSLHPLSGHLEAAMQRDRDLCGSVPASVLAVCDAKLNNLCKIIEPKVESNPLLALSIIMKAAVRLSGSVVITKGPLSVQKQHPYPTEIIESLDALKSVSLESTRVEAVCIPSSLDKIVQPVSLNISSDGYFLDTIAQTLGVTDANQVMLSRTVGKASSETRLYFAVPESYVLDLSVNVGNPESQSKAPLNVRASYFCNQDIYGDAIMASIGYTWRSKDLFHEDLSLQSYYRMLICKLPSGFYKLSREAILLADLPTTLTTKSNWRGSFPREILCSFCRLHRLSEPVFTTCSVLVKESCITRSRNEVNVAEKVQQNGNHANGTNAGPDVVDSGSMYQCEAKIFSKCEDLLIKCSPRDTHKRANDSIHNASLNILSWLNGYFKDLGISVESLNCLAGDLDIGFDSENLSKEFLLCSSVHDLENRRKVGFKNVHYTSTGQEVCSLKMGGSDSGVYPSTGSLLCMRYSVSLVTEGKRVKELLESNDDFEFEIGTGAVISPAEAVLTQMSVGQFATFRMDLPPHEFILAAANDSERIISMLSSQVCCLEYFVNILRVTEPPEERMEQALFSPPLSKQRVEYAVQHIRKSCATTLIDFGCGSGSLLDSLLDYPTSLRKIAGVDISQKSLGRAAKILHSKLSSVIGLESAVLYDGSITELDSRLCGFDIGTCLEVIEHMEEDQACLFGDIALSYFRPKILIVSTPNYEYNVILQRSNQDEDADEKMESQSCKFRNHDHKFEWTRQQFNKWASELAKRHNYNVEFSGVGGSGDIEPGFASQIAVFTREILVEEKDVSKEENPPENCRVVWEWTMIRNQMLKHQNLNPVIWFHHMMKETGENGHGLRPFRGRRAQDEQWWNHFHNRESKGIVTR